ncbi:MAG: ribonuclease domain-containing protein [Christensenellales bacterium]|jgi:guanyl-specific ribonuclease Sa
MMKKRLSILLSLLLLFGLWGCWGRPLPELSPAPFPQATFGAQETPAPALNEHGSYDQKDDVALFLKTFGRLPDNYITKAEARNLGWEGGSVEPFAPGKCIGGDRFGNFEGLLPEGRDYRECDIDTLGKDSRGAKRIVFSSEGEIYYTDDHYKSFTQLFP